MLLLLDGKAKFVGTHCGRSRRSLPGYKRQQLEDKSNNQLTLSHTYTRTHTLTTQVAAKLNLFCIIRLLFSTLSFRFVSLCSDLFRVILFESLTNFAAGDDASLAFWDSSRAEQAKHSPRCSTTN